MKNTAEQIKAKNKMELIDVAKLIAEGCGEILREGFHNIKEISEKSGPGDVVTDVDKRSEAFALAQLKKYRPLDGMLGEEGVDFEGETGYKWIIDPLDGTYNFALGIPLFCVSVAVCREGRPVAGVVFDPIHNEMFWAEKGKGAYLNDRKISVKNTDRVEDSVLYLSWVRGADRIDEFNEKAKELFAKVAYIRRIGTAALGLSYVAMNRIHGFVEIGLHPWDVAAGMLIIEEGGGTVSDRYGNEPILDRPIVDLVAANPTLHKNLMKELI
ncbi:MAG: inositol monophosphatase [Armatimonadetes bacterium]|nr:inositol monophosphatase [Candidatus Hippobium faecium]